MRVDLIECVEIYSWGLPLLLGMHPDDEDIWSRALTQQNYILS